MKVPGTGTALWSEGTERLRQATLLAWLEHCG